MAHYACMIQEGQEAERRKDALADGLREIAQRTFGEHPDEVEIQWDSLPKGFAWTGGEPSTSSIVVRSVPVGFDNDEREVLLRSMCDLWIETTGCTINEIVATAFDGPLPL